MNKIINKHGYEVNAPARAKLAIRGTSCKIGDTVYAEYNLHKVAKGTQFKVSKMWNNKYATVLEFEGTDICTASRLFRK